MRSAYRALVAKPEGRRPHLEDTSIAGRIILKCIFEKLDRVSWTGSFWLRIGTRNSQF
jgi:hypothetical protein